MSDNPITMRGLLSHAWQTVQNPQDGLRRLMALGFDRGHLWQALILVVTVSVLLAQLDAMSMGLPGVPLGNGVVVTPWTAAMMQVSGFVIMVFAIFWIGRAMGGEGKFEDSILAVVWLQFIMVCLQVVQSVLFLAIPFLGGVLAVVGVGLFFYLLTHFIAAIHGFTSLGRVFMMIISSLFGIMFGLTIVLALIGVTVPGSM